MKVSELSDEQLMNLINQQNQPQDFSQLSDEALMAAIDESTPIVDEAHPAVSWKDRTVVKNFGTGSGIGYLKEKYPNLQFKERDGNVLIKGKNENEYRKLDPSSFELADISDIAYDVGAGIAEGVATLGGAALGTTFTPGAGTLAGGAFAGGTASTALEGLRQKIGKELGINEEYDKSQLVASGIAGGLSPLLFGTGKAVTKAGTSLLGDVAEKGLIAKGAGEVYDKATRSAAPFLAGVTSGEKSKVYRDYIGNLDLMKQWDKNPAEFTQYIDDAGRSFEASLTNMKREAGEKIGDILKELPDRETAKIIDVSDVRLDYEQLANNLNLTDDLDAVDLSGSIMKDIKRNFGSWPKGKDGTRSFKGFKDNISYDEAMELRNKYRRASKFGSNISDLDPKNQRKVEIARDIYARLNDSIDNSFDKLEPGIGGRLKQARADYKEALAVENDLMKEVKTGGRNDYKKMFTTLNTLDNNSKQYIRERMSRIDPNITKKADLVEAFNKLNNPSPYPLSGQATSTTKTLALGALGYGAGQLGGEGSTPGLLGLGVGLLGLSPKAWRAYMKMGKRGEDIIKNQFKKAGQKVPKNLKNYYNRQMATQGVWNTLREREGE